MKLSLQRITLGILLAAGVGCSTTEGVSAPANEGNKPSLNEGASPLVKNAVKLRFGQYVDQRLVANPRYLGQITTRVIGVSGNVFILDQDVAEVAGAAIKKRFDAEGFQVLEGADAGNALFEVSGTIKELVLNVKNRDEISISIETTLKDAASGKVVWSGLVTEKNDRFAGVSGNNKADVIAYLNKELQVVSGKTVDAIGASLAASRPELFNLTPGVKAIKGVDVYVSPQAAPSAVGIVPIVPVASVRANAAPANVANGLLSMSTNPPRAKVYVDGVYFGLSPLGAEIEPGVHSVTLKLEGYKTVTEKVSVRKGVKTELELSLER